MARQLDEQLTTHFPPAGGAHAAFRRLRVLDVGPGQGTQAIRLARAGHLVTGLEADPVMAGALRDALAAEPRAVRDRLVVLLGDGRETGRHFGPACFDVVLCHGVLMYLPDPEPMLAGLARVLAPGGLLSLLVRNGDALAMRPGLRGDFASALHAFGSAGYAGYEGAAELAGSAGAAASAGYVNRLGLHARADRLEPMRATLTGINVPLHTWYGVRVFTDAAPDHAMPPSEPGALAALLAAEAAAGRTDPYRAVAALLHICGIRVAR